ncbi:hypothetical protein VTK56DRAFT_5705 [Thermocarpiscus australiensis]
MSCDQGCRATEAFNSCPDHKRQSGFSSLETRSLPRSSSLQGGSPAAPLPLGLRFHRFCGVTGFRWHDARQGKK